ncbi:23S rRNA (adenine(2503)-C(2))-methyltransferase RlmN [Candidatus Auribacterota bacterium]
MRTLTEYTLKEFEEELKSRRIKLYRAKQILAWIYKKGCASFDDMSDLPKELRDSLSLDHEIFPLTISKRLRSSIDKTAKYLFKTKDGHLLEGVYLTEKTREIICISTQVGCPLECSFCASGKSKFLRDLTTSEMVSEVTLIKNDLNKERINNIVFMGMGEPFLNYDNMMKTIEILRAQWGLGIGSRKITISTAGYVPGILRFAKENTQVRLAVSLHATTDDVRDKIMPVNRKYPLKSLLEALKEYVKISGRKVSVEYTLIDGLNDSPEDAGRLFKLSGDIAHTINLIPLNRTDEFKYHPPPVEKQRAFKNALIDKGVLTTLRREKGGDINAACGQLRLNK